MTTRVGDLATSGSARRSTLLTVAKGVGVLVGAFYVVALGLEGIASWLLVALIPAACALVALRWPALGGGGFLVFAAGALVWVLGNTETFAAGFTMEGPSFIGAMVVLVLPAAVAGAILLVAEYLAGRRT